MPYKIEKQNDGWVVKNAETGDIKGHHESKEDAERQLRLLEAVENDPSWEPKNG